MSLFRKITLALSAVLLAVLMGCAATPTQQSTGEYIDDAAITTRVKTAVFNESSLRTLEISVTTIDGTVYLSGLVGTQAEINKAGEIARGVSGVKSVRNDLRLQ